MKRAALVLVLMFVFAARGSMQADMGGEWAVVFSAPQGPQEFIMYVVQEGPRLSGRLTSDAGEFPLRGTFNDGEFTITWSFPDGTRLVQITFTGKVDGDSLSGTARIGDRGSGALSGMRIGQ